MKKVFLAQLLFVAGATAADFEYIEVERDDERYSVQASAVLDVDARAVRAVITDYNHMHWISGAVLRSQVLDRIDPGITVIEVRSRACFGIFCKTMDQVQFVDARDNERVVFRAIPAYSDVDEASSEWLIEPLGDRRTRLVWAMSMVPDFWVPPFIGTSMIQDGLRDEGRDMINGIEKLARERKSQ